MIEAVKPGEVRSHKASAYQAAVEEYVARVNAHLRVRDRYPGGHWDVAQIVPYGYRADVAARFEAAGWRVSYSTDNNDYADCFTIQEAK